MAQRVLLLGATGTIGRATARALVDRGHDVSALVRPAAGPGGYLDEDDIAALLPGVRLSFGSVLDAEAVAAAFGGGVDAVVSCLASRTGAPADAMAIDRDANLLALTAAERAGAGQFVLLSAICVQKPRLAFQHAKLAVEGALKASPVDHTIVRPTAYFKSLVGQFARLRAGRPYLMFGNGELTATKPISDEDCAAFIAQTLGDDTARNAVLPIGGPGPALTPREMGEAMFSVLRKPEKFRSVPPAFLAGIGGALGLAGRISPKWRDKAEFARTGHYYATESMLVLDEASGTYRTDLTPETGTETFGSFVEKLAAGTVRVERGDHAVF